MARRRGSACRAARLPCQFQFPPQPAHRQDQLAAIDDVFESRSTISQRLVRDVAPVAVEHVERHEDRRRRDDGRVGLAQPLEARSELLIVDRHLAVEHERASGQLRDGGGEVSEPARVVAGVAAD